MEVDESGSMFIRIAITILFASVLLLFAVAAFSSSDSISDEDSSLRLSAHAALAA